MKTILISLLAGVLCFGVAGCESDSDDSPATVTTVTTNTETGVVQTNVVAVEDAGGGQADAPGVLGMTKDVSGKWIGGYSGDGINALLSLTLVQDGETVTGTYSFSDAGSGDILSGNVSGSTLLLAVKRNGILCSLTGQVNEEATLYEGTWADKAGNSGTFSLR